MRNGAHQLRRSFACGLLLAALSAPAAAASLSFSGNLAQDDSIATFGFVLGSPGSVTLQTFSYSGGTNAQGAVISPGGFDPVVSLFDSLGNLVLTQDDAVPECNGVASDPVTSECFDILAVATLPAGSYLVAITQFDNQPIGPDFASGFRQSGANFTAIFECDSGQFCDVDADSRTSFWAADVSGAAVVPAPAAGGLLSLAVGVLAAARWRRGGRARP